MDIKEFLTSKYEPKKFEKFLIDTFYGLTIAGNDYEDTELNESEKRNIQKYRYLGSIELDDGKEIGFFEFVSKDTNIENKRVGFNAILKKLAGIYLLDGAIASFYHPDSHAFRLSLITFEYELDGKTNVSSLKRYTYVLGSGIPIKTAQIQLKNLNNSSLEAIKECFSVEPVSKEFFNEYKRLFEEVNEYLKKNNFANFKFDEKNIRSFSKNLLGRIIFLYFLQKKCWLGVRREWGDGSRDFLRELFYKNQNKNFYEDLLKPLFFEALNTKREDDYFKLINAKLPFLNGGLFEKKEFDNEFLYIDNEIFEDILETFSRFNFTIIEDTLDDVEVAIDPEMLGRVFENLLEENYRKGKGAFYTPREIVYYMCKSSILEYLSNFFEKDKLKELVFYKKTDDKYFLQNGKLIVEKLKNIKILDPAIGSGAFPMGMLLEIVEIIHNLNKTLNEEEIAKLKRAIIENSIYGVDIDKSAVDIAKLRFWISLVVDETKPLPLPNLDFKIMQGNSLIETIDGFDVVPAEIGRAHV